MKVCVYTVCVLGAPDSGEEWCPTELVLYTVVSCPVSSDNPAKVLCKGNQCLRELSHRSNTPVSTH